MCSGYNIKDCVLHRHADDGSCTSPPSSSIDPVTDITIPSLRNRGQTRGAEDRKGTAILQPLNNRKTRVDIKPSSEISRSRPFSMGSLSTDDVPPLDDLTSSSKQSKSLCLSVCPLICLSVFKLYKEIY